jgi:hypothetical protein
MKRVYLVPLALRVRLGWLLALVLLLGWPRAALSQADLQLQVSSYEVSVGDTLEVQLDAMSESDEAPTHPDLVVPNAFEVQGPSVGTRQQVSISGFRMQRQVGISATWELTATRAGVYSIGPGSVEIAGRRERAQAVQIRVLPEGQRAQRPQRRGRRGGLRAPFDPFDPFGNDDPFNDLFDRLRGGGGGFERLPEAPPDLIPERALDPVAFLEARVDTRRAVVGQQVTLTIYAHGAQGLFQEAAGSHEPSHPDFLAQRLVEDPGHQPVYQYTRDGQRWIAVKVRETALFPLRAGQLEIGPLEFGFLGRRYAARTAEGLRRSSRPIIIDVTEPPAEGKPPGYAGDVGEFRLGATVEPRRVTAGGSVAVTVRVQGNGRLPGALKLPEQAGVEWLEPTVRDDPSLVGTTVGGSRTFNYVVRLTRAGQIDLGKLSLSFYNPRTHRYQVWPTELGEVTVDPEPAGAAAPTAAAPARGPQLSDLVKFRKLLGPPPSAARWMDGSGFWWSLAVAPAGVLCLAGLGAARRRLRRRWAQREQSQAVHAQRALSDARRALGGPELGLVLSGAERAVYLAIEWATGLRARALLRSELEGRLGGAGLSSALATESADVLRQCGELRLAGAGLDKGAAASLLGRAESLVKKLLKQPPRGAAETAREHEADEARA